MKPTPLIILAALLSGLLIALSPFIFALLVLYGFVELIKYYFPSKHAKKKTKVIEKNLSQVNNFYPDFLRKEK
jgi:hypothetical protein